ncbi:CHASE3 domain-containing protein [Subsaxibacter sp. CAU 1640]|uniref:CHASE3 domain-containing protein n=1 Tax=Subsaxibacter sp. CAU 1640 TaxID=2933271 RepID=UPI0020042292|nr:CHASE3 domain-containing protein [Subsaxibacter sp. CAU 1640]MCK7589632.1 CHASE3 domain-containing protein [Subsaxibacter sp. CAU 1640]
MRGLKSIYNSERFLRILFGSALFVVLCMGGLAYKYIRDLSESFILVQHTYEVHIELEKLTTLLKDAESGKRGFIISKDTTFLSPLINNREKLAETLENVKNLTADSPEQNANIAVLQEKIGQSMAIFDQTLAMAKDSLTHTQEFRNAFTRGRFIMNSIRNKVNEMTMHENELLKERREESSESLSNAPLMVYYTLIISLCILLITYAQLSRSLKVLRTKNEQLETFKEATNQSAMISKYGNWIWHVDEETFEFSDNLYRLLGEKPQSFAPTIDNFMEFVHPEDQERFVDQVNQMYLNRDLPYLHYRIIQRDGTLKHFKAYAKLGKDSEGHQRLIGTTTDITDEKENYRILEEKNAELERNNEELASFNYVASHDLQEPLRKIQTFISRLEDKELHQLSDSGKLYIERIKTSASRMRSLIDDLLQYSRTNRSETSMEFTNINELIEAAKHDLAEVIEEKHATVKVESIPEMKVIPFQIKQLFLNLISNSIKYSKEDEAPIINICYSKTKSSQMPWLKSVKYKSYHTIAISDNGIGFEPSYAEKIFVLFNRLHSKGTYSGTGIGLSICKKIMNNHNGFIQAEGRPNNGAIFTVYLPVH